MLKINRLAIFFFIILTSALPAAGQEDNSINTYSPYTLYGIGDLNGQGLAANMGMGGITLGVRDRMMINYGNPASLSVQDTLSFMIDFGLRQHNVYSKTKTSSTSANSLNINHVVLSFRVAKGLAFSAGVMPYSNIGYNIEFREKNPEVINQVGDVLYQYKGEGGLNQVFVGGGLALGKHLSVGGQLYYYFGSIDRYSNEIFNSPYNQNVYMSSSIKTGKIAYSAGIQYHNKLNNNTALVIGSTFRPKANLSSSQEDIRRVGTDTIKNDSQHLSNFFTPMEIGLGFTLAKEFKFRAGFDYTYQDWSGFNSGGSSSKLLFKADKNHSFKVGGEYTPNFFDIRKFLNRVTYRGGAYYTQSYMFINGKRIDDFGITFGFGIPISRVSATGVNVSFAVGQRGTTTNGLVKENYVTLTLSASIHELWFRRYKYD